MTDPITLISGTTGPFDTAAMQIALANAQADAVNTSALALLQEVANTNDTFNADALGAAGANVTAPTNNLFTNSLLSVDTSGTATTTPADPFTNPFITPDITAFPTEFGSDSATAISSGSVKAQQLHDLGVLQKDAAQLEEAANASNPVPLGSAASTLDLSPAAQGIVGRNAVASVNGFAPLPAQLAQLSAILQPVANEPLTAALLQQIQEQLTAAQNPMQLSLNAIVMSFIAAAQPNPSHEAVTTVSKVNAHMVAPVAAIDGVAIEGSAIR